MKGTCENVEQQEQVREAPIETTVPNDADEPMSAAEDSINTLLTSADTRVDRPIV